MTKASIMLEGQIGLNWERWGRWAEAAESLGFHGLYRSDHFPAPGEPYKDGLELQVSLAWLASNTSRIRFGALVSPISYRDPVALAWQASGIDALAEGRLDIGLGAGWNVWEHGAYGYELQELPVRFARFEEGIQVVRLLTRSSEPVHFSGTYFQLSEAMLMPRSTNPSGPPITIGGAGPKRTMPLVAKYADEWNCVHKAIDDFQQSGALLDELLQKEGRELSSIRRSMMSTVCIGTTDEDITRRLNGASREDLIAGGQFVGTPDEIIEQIQPYLNANLDDLKYRFMDLDDLDAVELFADKVLPHVSG